jgi:hypothetical protein
VRRGVRADVIAAALIMLGAAVSLLLAFGPVNPPAAGASQRPVSRGAKRATTLSIRTSHADSRSPAAPNRNRLVDDNDNLPADCVPNPSGPPSGPYQLGLVGELAGGTLTSSLTTVSNIDAKFCALVTLVNGTASCAATGDVTQPVDGQVFGPLSVVLTLVPGMTPTIGFTARPGVNTGGFTCQPSTNGLAVTLNASVGGTTAPVFGVSCAVGPVQVPLTGSFTGPLTDTTATLKSSNFTIPALQPSATCPSAVAADVDSIAGLPLAVGSVTANLPVTSSLYQPIP